MYKLIIIEDEQFIRNGLTKMLNWNNLGFNLISVFSCGNDAIDFLTKVDIDVILSDIKMSNGTGLDVAKFVYENNLPIKIVFLSAHDGFSLAQQAIQYGVEKYLLKPLSLPDIRETFSELKEKLDKETALEDALMFKSNSYQNIIDYEIEKILSILYSNNIHSQEQYDKTLVFFEKHSLDMKPLRLFHCKLNLIQNDSYNSIVVNYGLQEFNDQLIHILSSFDDRLTYYNMECKDGVFIGFFLERPLSSNDNPINTSLFDNIPMVVKTLTNLTSEVTDKEEYLNIYEYADKKVKKDLDTTLVENLQEIKDKTLKAIIERKNNETTWSEFLDFTLPLSLDATYQHILHIAYRYINHLYQNDKSESFATLTSNLSSLFSIKDRNSLILWCVEKFEHLRDTALETRYTDSISKIEKYIHDNYSQNLSLTTVAEEFYFNPVYLSRKFKQQTGKNFTIYLAEVRVKEAKRLILNTDKKIKDICEIVGYSNIKYFYRIFKSVTGYTPTEYRDKLPHNK